MNHQMTRLAARPHSQHGPWVTVNGKELQAGVVNDNEVRAAAGLTFVISAAAISNGGIQGHLPTTIWLIFLTPIWRESALGLCLGCEIHGLLARRGWAEKDPDFEIYANGACDVPQPTSQAGHPGGARGNPRPPGR